jgi:two-component system phosphate regulon sensor histidine kinase PhoR
VRRALAPAALVAIATLLTGLVVGLSIEWWRHAAAKEDEVDRLGTIVTALVPKSEGLFALSSEEADRQIRQWAEAGGLRVTLITADGRVHADSWTLPSLLGRLENHGKRPEVIAARAGQIGVARRRSVTTDHPTTYVAIAVGSADHPQGFLRVAREATPNPWPWGSLLLAAVSALAALLVTARLTGREHGAVAAHLVAWTDLPAGASLDALAEEADRHFRELREELGREVAASRTALESVSEGVLLLDRQGVVQFANHAAASLLGKISAGRPLVEAARAPELLAAVEEVLRVGGTQHTTVSVSDGRELAVRVCAVTHPVLSAAVVVRDLRAERQLDRARRALVSDLAHELRTPLTVLGGLAEELQETTGDSEILATLLRQVRKLTVFAEELEELTRIESGEMRLRVEQVDAETVARQVSADLAGRAKNEGVELVVVGGPAPLRTDPVRLAQVLTNLVDNAIRYNRSGGRVIVRTLLRQETIEIEVEDDGIGIPASEIELVFQRFYRVRRDARPEGGSGLGLAIVKHLVRALGGTVRLASREGVGTVVTVDLPPATG